MHHLVIPPRRRSADLTVDPSIEQLKTTLARLTDTQEALAESQAQLAACRQEVDRLQQLVLVGMGTGDAVVVSSSTIH